jgi:hypothetical protein
LKHKRTFDDYVTVGRWLRLLGKRNSAQDHQTGKSNPSQDCEYSFHLFFPFNPARVRIN